MTIGFIYGLIDPRNQHIRYVGQTSKSIQQRLKTHLYNCKHKNTHKDNWIRLLVKQNLKPQIILIEECRLDQLNEKEIYWIDFYKKKFKLTNSTDGGDGCLNLEIKQKTRDKIRNNNLGRKHSESTKELIRDFMLSDESPVRGRIFSEEHIENLRKASSKRNHTDSTKKAIGKSVCDDKNGNSIKVELTDINSKEKEIFGSYSSVYKKYGFCPRTINKYNKTNKPYKNKIVTLL